MMFPFWYHDQGDCRQRQDQLWQVEDGRSGRFDMGNIAQVLPKYQDVISKRVCFITEDVAAFKNQVWIQEGGRGLLFTASWLCGIIALKID
jgi:hypothetical protein